MPRPRKQEDQWMPPRVYRHARGFVFKPTSGETLMLAPKGATEAEVWKAYNDLKKEEDNKETVGALISEYMESATYADLTETTRNDYLKYSKKVLKVFGHVNVHKLQPKHIRMYMDKRGAQAKVQANREHSFMGAVFSWAYERGKVKVIPTRGVRKFPEKARDRYITDVEYQAVYDIAPPVIQVAMEISYLCAARKGDVLSATYGDVLKEGLFIQQNKTHKKQIKAWTPRLMRAIELAKTLAKTNIRPTRLIVKPDGMNYTHNGFNSLWRSTMLKAREQTGLPLDFTFHDIKAKGISDYEGGSRDKQAFSGHKTERQVGTYDRKIKVTPSLNRD